jgi:hypothetical protein
VKDHRRDYFRRYSYYKLNYVGVITNIMENEPLYMSKVQQYVMKTMARWLSAIDIVTKMADHPGAIDIVMQ